MQPRLKALILKLLNLRTLLFFKIIGPPEVFLFMWIISVEVCCVRNQNIKILCVKLLKNSSSNKPIMCTKSLQSHLTLWDPMDCSLPRSSVHGILQARILELVAISCSSGSSWPRDQTHVSYVSCIGRWVLYHQHHLGSPSLLYVNINNIFMKNSCTFKNKKFRREALSYMLAGLFNA